MVEGFVEGEDGGFGGGVVGHAGDADVGCYAGDGDDVAFVCGDHGGEEGFGCVPVTQDVDLEWRYELSVCAHGQLVGLLTSKIFFKYSSSVSRIVCAFNTPALFTRIVGAPSVALIFSAVE